jgi:hypothetical protein
VRPLGGFGDHRGVRIHRGRSVRVTLSRVNREPGAWIVAHQVVGRSVPGISSVRTGWFVKTNNWEYSIKLES